MILKLSGNMRVIPIINGSADYGVNVAAEVKAELLELKKLGEKGSGESNQVLRHA